MALTRPSDRQPPSLFGRVLGLALVYASCFKLCFYSVALSVQGCGGLGDLGLTEAAGQY